MKEVMTSFDVSAATKEINNLVKNTHISKIYQIDTKTLLLKLRKPNMPKIQLLIEAGKRIHLTSYVHKTPTRPSAFCMSLRKYLDNGIINSVRQHEFERIAIIDINTRQGNFRLISELFGRGNIILVDPESKILHAMTYKRMKDRNILRDEQFLHPPERGKNPKTIEYSEFKKIKDLGEIEIVRALTKFLSMSGTYSEEILKLSDVNKRTNCNSLTENEIETIFNQLKNLLFLVKSEKTNPSIIVNKNKEWIDVTAIKLLKYKKNEQKSYETFNIALDEYYAKISNLEKTEQKTKDVKSEVARYTRILKRQEKALESLKEPIIKNKEIGDLIYQHFGELKSLLQKILKQKRNGKTWKQIISEIELQKKTVKIPEIYFHSLDPFNQIFHVSIENNVFSLNLRQTIQDNANKYYIRSKKAEKKLKGAENQLKETKEKIKQIEKRITLAKDNVQPLIKRRKKEWFEKFRWVHSSDGFLIIGGKDSTTNEILIKKYMKTDDIVFHAEISGAPFVIIKTNGKSVPNQTLNEAAQLAASYSKAWKEMLTALNVYWIHPDQVSKTPPSGEYLRKGSFIIRGNKNFIRGVPLKIAIGVITKENTLDLIGGPVKAISNQTNIYLVIIPGNQKSAQLAKKIRHNLSEKVSEKFKKAVTKIRIEEIQNFIPLGRGKIK